ncbi:galactose oxidase-like domain-containing protein [Streptomyces sediminimaris]|uniref:galactose oxidase-like domain-containing protein n=1 Tax=Streptomyces sediminimaris TaxID=3383721 RepID=UPI00399A9B5B
MPSGSGPDCCDRGRASAFDEAGSPLLGRNGRRFTAATDQRYVWLETGHQEGVGGSSAKKWTLEVTPPANPAAAPPDDYMLVVVDGHGTPSEATALRFPSRLGSTRQASARTFHPLVVGSSPTGPTTEPRSAARGPGLVVLRDSFSPR